MLFFYYDIINKIWIIFAFLFFIYLLINVFFYNNARFKIFNQCILNYNVIVQGFLE